MNQFTLLPLPLVALLLLSAGTLDAQSTNRQVGTQFTVTADPLVSRPHTPALAW